MKVLFVLEYFYPYRGGVERLFKGLAEELSGTSNEVVVLTASYSQLPSNEKIGNVVVYRIKCNSRFQFTFKAVAMALKLAKHCDIIHTSTYNAALPAWIAAKWHAKPILITVHEYWGRFWWRFPYLNWMQRVVFWCYEQFIFSLPFHKLVAVSNHTASQLQKRVTRRKIDMVYNGQNTLQTDDRPASRSHYLFVGRLGVSKGIDILIEAISMALDADSDLKFKLVVPTTPKLIYTQILELLGTHISSGQVELLHNVDDDTLLRLYTCAKAVIIPSAAEGFGFVAAESTALEVPIIHSGRGALSEVVGGKFLVFEPYTASALFNTIMRAEQNEFMSSPIKNFPIKLTAQNYMALYATILGVDLTKYQTE